MTVLNIQAAHTDIDSIFKMILPQYDMDIRDGQVKLCHDLFDALAGKQIALCDAGVGIGKTIAYIVAAVMLDKHMPVDDMVAQYYDSTAPARLPFLVSTSSMALQQAILTEHIPFLLETLQKHGMIEAPFSGQVQKGKENYVCRSRLRRRLAEIEHSHKNEQQMEALMALKTEKELDKVPYLGHFDRRRVCVPRKCYPDCPDRELCSYQQYMRDSKKAPHLFQVCNHHYFLADAIHHEKGYSPLLPYFRAVIVDEVHQLYPTVQSMCGSSVSRGDTAQLLDELRAVDLNTDANRLRIVLDALFDLFYWQAKQEALYRNSSETKQVLKAVLEQFQHIGLKVVNGGKYARTLAMVREMTFTLMRFYSRDARYFCFTEWDDKGSPCLKAVEKNYRFRLNRMLWNRPMGIILTSGTLAAGRDMEFFKDRMGLSSSDRLTESYTPSPFDYKSNCLLYLPGDLPSCKSNYVFRVAAAKRIAELIQTTAGHTLVLCTSYTEMNEIFQKIHAMHLPYPLFAMPRRGDKHLQAFRASGNGVLFAAGSCWEGMDFPGDIVSSLVIVRLPFPRRDALHDGERQRYMDVRQFIKEVAVPEMQVKLRQGFGRGIRLMEDTCVVSILDGRAAPDGSHHTAVLDALPECQIAQDIGEAETFIRERKRPEYFMGGRGACLI